jgi:hypothetical protein
LPLTGLQGAARLDICARAGKREEGYGGGAGRGSQEAAKALFHEAFWLKEAFRPGGRPGVSRGAAAAEAPHDG